MRPEGFVLALGVALGLAYDRRWSTMLRCVGLAMVPIGTFFLRNYLSTGTLMLEYATDSQSRLNYWAAHIGGMAKQVGHFALPFLTQGLLSWPVSARSETMTMIGALLVCPFILLGVANATKVARRSSATILAMTSFCYFYFLIHAFWINSDARYALPLLPFLCGFVIMGGLRLQHLWPKLKNAFSFTLAPLVICYSYQNVFGLYQSYRPVTQNLVPSATNAWLKQNVPLNGVALTPMAPVLYLYSGRTSINILPAKDEEEFVFLLWQESVQLIVDRPFDSISAPVGGDIDPNEEWRQIRRWIRLYPKYFPTIYENESEGTTVYAVKRPPYFVEAYGLYREALRLFSERRWREGQRLIGKANSLNNELAVLHNASGATHLLLEDDLKAAHAELIKAVAIRPNYPTALLNLARADEQMGRTELARQNLQKSIDASRSCGSHEEFLGTIRRFLSASAPEIGDEQIRKIGDLDDLSGIDVNQFFRILDKGKKPLALADPVFRPRPTSGAQPAEGPMPWEAGYRR